MSNARKLRERLAPDLRLTGILPCQVDARLILARVVLDQLRQAHGTAVFDSTVRSTIRLAESAAVCQPITTYDPDGHGAADYRAVAAELVQNADVHESGVEQLIVAAGVR